MTPVRVAQSSSSSAADAAEELRAQLGDDAHALVVYFASPAYPQAELAKALHLTLGARHTIGCSTAGEIISGSMSKRSVVAMALGDDDIRDLSVQVVGTLSDPASLDRALRGMEYDFGTPVRELDVSTHVGLVLMDGMTHGEERFLDALGDRTDLLFVGGSAGDDLAFKETWVSADGYASTRGAILAVFKPTRGFEVIKTQSFVESGKRLVATKVDEQLRIIHEFDGRPADEAYAAAIGITTAELPDRWMAHPLGLMDDGEPFVRSPARLAGSGIEFFCSVKTGMELSVLTSTDIVAETRQAIEAKSSGGATALINFNCILRTLDLEHRGQSEAYGDVFRPLPTIGFSTYGEAYVGHVNQTATMLLLR
jgi:hypothetical protein